MKRIKELREICQNSKSEKEAWYAGKIIRRISIYFTILLLKTPITPNQVSFVSIASGLVAGYFFSLGDYLYMIIGAISLHFWVIFDCVDGEIARYKKTMSTSGKYLEDMNHYIVFPFTFFTISVGLSKIFENVFILIVGSIASLITCWAYISWNITHTISSASRLSGKTSQKRGYKYLFYDSLKSPFTPNYFMLVILIISIVDYIFVGRFDLMFLYFIMFSAASLRHIVGLVQTFNQLKKEEG